MNPGRFYGPSMGMRIGISPMMGVNSFTPRNVGFFARIGNSIRAFNWSGLINGANKTLNVVNQTIPLIKQAGPMFNNMRSMFRLAKAFGSETALNRSKNINKNFNNSDSKFNYNRNVTKNFKELNTNNPTNDNSTLKKEVQNYNYPNFFI